jgi:hypothetical protein
VWRQFATLGGNKRYMPSRKRERMRCTHGRTWVWSRAFWRDVCTFRLLLVVMRLLGKRMSGQLSNLELGVMVARRKVKSRRCAPPAAST